MKKMSKKNAGRSTRPAKSRLGPLEGVTLTITGYSEEAHSLPDGKRHVPTSGDFTLKAAGRKLKFVSVGKWHKNWKKCTLEYKPGAIMSQIPPGLQLNGSGLPPGPAVNVNSFARYQGTVRLPHDVHIGDRSELQEHEVYLIVCPDDASPRAILMTSAHDTGVRCGSCSHCNNPPNVPPGLRKPSARKKTPQGTR